MKKEVRLLRSRAVDSLVLAIELFNRPSEAARPEGVLMHLDHSFEMLLKAIIVHKGGKIRDRRQPHTIGFAKCVGKCLSDQPVKCLQPEQALTLQTINGLRDAAQHYLLHLSEQEFYVFSQSGVSLFIDLFVSVFDEPLTKFVPQRVMPVSTEPPKDIDILLDDEFTQILSLLRPGRRRFADARARVRPIAIMENAVSGSNQQPSEAEITRSLRSLRGGTPWRDLFPGVAGLTLQVSGDGPTFNLRLTKREGVPVRLVGEGEEAAAVVGVKRVDELGFYSLGFNDLVEKLGDIVSRSKLVAVIRYLHLEEDEDCFKLIRVGKVSFKRYSPRALDTLRSKIPRLDVEAVWKEHGFGRRPRSVEVPELAV